MKPVCKRHPFRTACALVAVAWLAACSVAVFDTDDASQPAPPAGADAEAETEPNAAAQEPLTDVALVVGTAPHQRIESVKPGHNAAAGLIGDTKNVDHGSGPLAADYGASETGAAAKEARDAEAGEAVDLPPPPRKESVQPSGPAPRAPAGQPAIPDLVPAEGPAQPAPRVQRAEPPEAPSEPPAQATPDAGGTAAVDIAAARGAFVQLGAFKSPADVEAGWAAMRRKFPDLLADFSLTMRKIDLGDRGLFYRLLAGPLPNPAAARGLCADLQARGQDCLVRVN